MALFDTGIHSNQVATAVMTEVAIIDLGYVAETCRRTIENTPHAWEVENITITITADASDNSIMRLESVIGTLNDSTNNAQYFRALLEKNYRGLGSCAYSLVGNDVVLITERPTIDLDQSEVSNMITQMILAAKA